MSVLNRVRRATTEPAGGRTRTSAAAAGAVAVGVLCALTACGVQPTGLHLTADGPITADGPAATSPSTPVASGKYPVYLFMLKGNFNSITPVVRYADHGLSINELVDALGGAQESEVTDGYHTDVPPYLGDQLKPTREKHAYQIPTTMSDSASLQVICTLDLYWVLNPDPDSTIRPTTQLISPAGPYGWDECNLQGFATAITTLKEEGGIGGFEGASPVAAAKVPNEVAKPQDGATTAP